MAYSTAQAVIAASGFTVDGTVTRNDIVTAVNISFTATSDITTMQFTIGTLQPAVRPKQFASLVVALTGGGNSRFVAVDVSATGSLVATAHDPKDGVYMASGATIWLRGMYMSC